MKQYFFNNNEKDLNSHSLKNFKSDKNINNNFIIKKKNKKNKSKNEIQINVVPLIDVLLILLIVFMITAEAINKNIDINLPNGKIKNEIFSNNLKKDDINIFLKKNGEIIIDNKKFLNNQDLENYINNTFFDHEKIIILSADKSLEYQKIIEILILLNNCNFYKIKMAYED